MSSSRLEENKPHLPRDHFLVVRDRITPLRPPSIVSLGIRHVLRNSFFYERTPVCRIESIDCRWRRLGNIENASQSSSTPSPSISAIHVSPSKERTMSNRWICAHFESPSKDCPACVQRTAPICKIDLKRSVQSHSFVCFITSDHRRISRWKSNEPFICSRSQCPRPSDGSQKTISNQWLASYRFIHHRSGHYLRPVRLSIPSVSRVPLVAASENSTSQRSNWSCRRLSCLPFSRPIRWRSSIEFCNVRFHLFAETFGVLNGYLQLAQPISARRMSLVDILQRSPWCSCRLTFVKYLRMLFAFELVQWFSTQWIWTILRGVVSNSLSNRKEDERVKFIFILLPIQKCWTSIGGRSSRYWSPIRQCFSVLSLCRWQETCCLDPRCFPKIIIEHHQCDDEEAEKISVDRSSVDVVTWNETSRTFLRRNKTPFSFDLLSSSETRFLLLPSLQHERNRLTHIVHLMDLGEAVLDW